MLLLASVAGTGSENYGTVQHTGELRNIKGLKLKKKIVLTPNRVDYKRKTGSF